MKRHPFALYCALIAVLLLTACLKHGPIAGPPGQYLFRISQINDMSTYPDSFRVYYNRKGYPTQLLPSVVSTGKPMWLFRYDDHHRLIARIGAYDTGIQSFEMAYRYVHDPKGNIIRDSVYVFGRYDTTVNPVRIYAQAIRTTAYSYDNRDRITRTVTHNLTPEFPHYRTTTNYYYNSDGNAWKIENIYLDVSLPDSLCIPHCPRPDTSVTYPVYGNKPDYHNLHPVWQFIDRNYNKNNAYKIISSDPYGLPREIAPAPPLEYMEVLGIFMPRAGLRYEYRP
nr:hypothetical protein [uncultured Chitinophaga sp.]